MDERLRREERDSDADKNDAAALAAFLSQRQRRGETAADLAGKLAEYAQDTRKGAYSLLAMNEDQQVLQEALILFGQQIDQARELAIQPREGDAPLPEREVILQSIQRTLTADQARVFLNKKEVHEPRLILVPVTSVERYIEALQQASESMEGARRPDFEDFARVQRRTLATQAQVEGNKIKKWKLAITEGAQLFPVPTWD